MVVQVTYFVGGCTAVLFHLILPEDMEVEEKDAYEVVALEASMED